MKVKEKNLVLRKTLGIISILGIVTNTILRFTNTYGDATFWIVIIVFAIIAFPVMNWLKK
jgi:hypothetical protein